MKCDKDINMDYKKKTDEFLKVASRCCVQLPTASYKLIEAAHLIKELTKRIEEEKARAENAEKERDDAKATLNHIIMWGNKL